MRERCLLFADKTITKQAGEYIYILGESIDYLRQNGPDSVGLHTIINSIPKVNVDSSIPLSRCFLKKEDAESFAEHLPKNERNGSLSAFFNPTAYWSIAAVFALKLEQEFVLKGKNFTFRGAQGIGAWEYYFIDVTNFNIKKKMGNSDNVKIYFGGKERQYTSLDLQEKSSYCAML